MYNEKYINKIKDVINEQYDLIVDDIKAASRGVDGETWIINSGQRNYFVKIIYYISCQKGFLNGINTLNLLNVNGINNISSIVKNKSNSDFISFNGGLLAIYNYVNGETDYNYPYNKIINMLIPVYKIHKGTNYLYREDYDICPIIEEIKKLLEISSKYKKLDIIIKDNQSIIFDYINKLEYYNSIIDKKGEMVITHGDACVNVMVNKDEAVLVDWDDSLVAPIERDCWFFIDSKSKINYIDKCLANNNIDYKLSYNMLIYYAYKNALIYIIMIINKYLEYQNEEILIGLDDIFTGWVRKKINSIS